jgi:hypothetical protein
MHTSLIAIVLISIVIPASEQVSSGSEVYNVSEITRVISPHIVECKLDNYKPAPVVRFRVYLQGVDAQNVDATNRKMLEERLNTAKHIELHNATLKSYFRIEAELWLDGKPFKVTSVVKPIEDETQPTRALVYQPIPALSKPYKPAESQIRPTLVVKGPSVSVKKLLDREIDCSILTDDTPLAEALELLCESVQPRLPLLIRWDDLQANTFIEKETPIGVEGFGRLKLRYALSHVLQAAAGREPTPTLIADGGILILGSQEMLQKHKSTRVYEVRDLLAPPSTGGMYQQGGGGMYQQGGSYGRSNLENIVGNFSR